MDNSLKLFIESVSEERFQRYSKLVANDEFAASELYVANAKIAQSFYIPLQALEVTLRNSIHGLLKEEICPYWFDQPNFLLINQQLEHVVDAKIRIKNDKKKENAPICSSRVVAALPLGFWSSMFNHNYETLWRSNLHKIVKTKKSEMTRKRFSGPLHLIRNVRNRISHHECIIDGKIENIYHSILEILGYLSPRAQFWVSEESSFVKTYEGIQPILSKMKENSNEHA